MKEIYFATHNKHKFEEVNAVAKEYDIIINWLNLEYDEKQDDNIEKIAFYSCESLLKNKPELIDKNFFVEDAGLFIEALNGFPGPYSAYVFKTIGNDGILKLMDKKKIRDAYFESVVALYSEDKISLFKGCTKGLIISSLKGKEGFGFDPLFKPEESKYTFSQMSLKTKNLYSHRQKSVREMFTSLTAFDKKITSSE